MINNEAPGSTRALFTSGRDLGDVLGGLAAMLVSLPSAIAFGLLVYSPLGAAHAGKGAMMGILGAIAIGLVAPAFGGTRRLISGPSAPSAAVLAAMTSTLVSSGNGHFEPDSLPLIITLVALTTGALQLIYGMLGGGRLIKYIPYPVVAGYLSGVGILIIIGQLPKLLGLAKGVGLWQGLGTPALWKMPALVVGSVSIAVMVSSRRFTRAIPAPIFALTGGVAAYFGLATVYPELASLVDNSLVIGRINSGSSAGFLGMFAVRWSSFSTMQWADLGPILLPAAMLSVLLSIDTLKTCVVLDALTRSRHNSNRELRGQGLGNMISGFIGGMPGSGMMGATLVNLNSGGKTRASGIAAGVFALAAFLMLERLVAWVPVSALAGILIVVGLRMVDPHILHLLKHESTRFDFLVVAAVVLTALSVDLMAAAGIGLGLSILLFLRDQIRGSVVRRRGSGNRFFSKKRRLPGEMAVLEAKGSLTYIFELQGSLFFGTTDQLFSEIEPILSKCRHLILDMRRIHSVDFTATHMLEQIEAQIKEHGGSLIFSNVPASLPTGQDLRAYFSQVGLLGGMRDVKMFSELDEALEWAEERILTTESAACQDNGAPLELPEIHLLSGLSAEELRALKPFVGECSFPTGKKIFSRGDKGDELFLIRRGNVRILLPLEGGRDHHLATFAEGDFFGDMSFLDRRSRSADAVASTDVDLYRISRSDLDRVASEIPRIGMIFAHMAHVLSMRLRQTDTELRVLEDW